jgi:esterase/lipase superfamily enzyme
VCAHQPIRFIGFLLLLLLLCVCVGDFAEAQSRWPPWQSYGEAEKSARSKLRRHATPKQSELDALNRKVEELRQAGKIGEAIPVAERALRVAEKRYGGNHAATAAALTTLAELYIAQNRYADAEPLLKRVLAIREKASPDSPEVADALYALASLYKKQGRAAEAEPLLRRSAALSDRAGTGREAVDGGGAAATVGEAGAKRKDDESKRIAVEAETQRKANAEAERSADVEAEADRLSEEYEVKRKAAAEAKRLAEEALSKRHAAAEATRLSDEYEAKRKAADEAKGLAEEALTKRIAEVQAEKLAAEKPAKPKEEPRARAYRRELPPAAASRDGGASTGVPQPPVAAKEGGGAADRAAAPTEAPAAPSPTMAPKGGLAAQQEKWDVVPVFYGTDRAEQPNPKRVAYSSDRGHRLELGRALVTVPKLHEVPQIERPWAIRIPYFDVTIYEQAEDPNKHFTMQEIKKLPKAEFLRLVRQRLAGSARFKNQALVFVHGYNTAFDNAVYRTAQIAYDLKFDGAPFVYSWPSGGAVASYTYDRESAGASKPYMRAFLDMVVKETGAKAVSVIAHSMGNQPLLDVLKDMKSSAPAGVVINQVILAAPDVDSDTFAQLAQAIKGLAKGVTLYTASNDRALIVSRNFWGYYRAGDVPPGGPLVLPGIDTIDVTAASTDAFAINHSGYAQNNTLLKDIGELIETGRRPPDKRILKPKLVTTDKGPYWRYVAPPAP